MMQQYFSIKNSYPEHLLFYRMGDFYELFFEDAKHASNALDIALTKRGKMNDAEVPMCGVPAQSSDPYIAKLINAGYKVAICEQMETPEEARKRGSQAVVKRDVVRIITPGTLLEDNLLEARNHNHLCSMALEESTVSIAWVDISTGQFGVASNSLVNIHFDLARLTPSEIILSEKALAQPEIYDALRDYRQLLTVRANHAFEPARAEQRLLTFFKINTLSGLGNFASSEISASGALLEYLEYTQKLHLPRLGTPKKIDSSNFMLISDITRRNLELDRNLEGGKRNTLRHIIDQTITAAGGRLMSSYLTAPLRNVAAINQRLDNLESLIHSPECRNGLRTVLHHFPDIERALSRVFAERGTPRDLTIIRDGLHVSTQIADVLYHYQAQLAAPLRHLLPNLGILSELRHTLTLALEIEATMQVRDGGFIRTGFHPQLDIWRNAQHNAQQQLAYLQTQYRADADIATLKITRNNVIGYYVEVTAAHSKKVLSEKFIHKQTLGSAVRYTTKELLQLEQELLNSNTKAIEFEKAIFQDLCAKVIEGGELLNLLAQCVAKFDVFSALAHIAVEYGYTRPIVDDSHHFNIKGGRHPIVERNLKGQFIPNSCTLDNNQKIWLITGPNMAGKSTFLRQNALIAIMAQIGSFVPAETAHIGVIDKLFSRVGAGDDISRGHSTFMVEMTETAAILNNATARSFIILDEIGRGTSTYDGLAIAWAAIEHINDKLECRTLFATHYHELTDLEGTLLLLACYTVAVQEWNGEIVFLHSVIPGKAERSYGIHVAALAGIPEPIIERATLILHALEQKTSEQNFVMPTKLSSLQPSLIPDNDNARIITMLQEVEPETLTPRAALDFIYKIKELIP